MRRSTSEPAVRGVVVGTAGSTAGRRAPYASQRHGHLTPAGQRRKRSRPAVGAAQAVGRHKKAPLEGDSSGAKVRG